MCRLRLEGVWHLVQVCKWQQRGTSWGWRRQRTQTANRVEIRPCSLLAVLQKHRLSEFRTDQLRGATQTLTLVHSLCGNRPPRIVLQAPPSPNQCHWTPSLWPSAPHLTISFVGTWMMTLTLASRAKSYSRLLNEEPLHQYICNMSHDNGSRASHTKSVDRWRTFAE